MNISIPEAVAALEAALPRPVEEHRPLAQARGRVLSQDLTALCDHPGLDDSALDGIAVRLEDTREADEARPVTLEVIGESRAGAAFGGKLEAGQAVRIYTGAPVPSGADGIVPVERLAFEANRVRVLAPGRAQDIRRQGSDFAVGDLGLPRGTLLRPPALALAAAMGYATLPVWRPWRVALLSTGDEVREPGEALEPGQVYDSNLYGLAALLEEMGVQAVRLPHALDTPEALTAALGPLGEVDLLLTSGGVSMGRYDLVRDLLIDQGQVDFWKVRIRPGGPAILGRWRDLPVFGLPGNPVSALVVFEVIVRPALLRAQGHTGEPHRFTQAVSRSHFRSVEGKTAFWRALLSREGESFAAYAYHNQLSSGLRGLATSNALVVVEPGLEVRPGDTVQAMWL